MTRPGVNWRNLRVFLPVCAAILIADQTSKWIVVDLVMIPPRVIEITGFFNLVMVWNTGVSFGLFSGNASWVLIVFTGAITAGLGVWLLRADGCWLPVALTLVVGGATGNLIDRVRYGAVADFLDFHAAGWHWPAFNIADGAITIGASMLLIDALAGRRGMPVAQRAQDPTTQDPAIQDKEHS